MNSENHPTSRRPRALARTAAGLLLAMTAALLAPSPAYAAGTITIAIQGEGRVTGIGIDCLNGTGDCSEAHEDTEICIPNQHGAETCSMVNPSTELTATPVLGSGFAFTSWSGCDSPAAAVCVETVNVDETITAVFADVENPTVTGLSPSGGVHDGTITLTASATDNAAVNKVEFWVRGAWVGQDTTPPYQLSFNTASVSDGAAAITAWAFDTSGRMSSSLTSSITIDNTVPSLTVTSGPNADTFGTGSTQTWAFTASDANMDSVQCSVVEDGQPASYAPCTGGSTGHSVTGRPEGTHRFFVRATDDAGLVSVAQRTFTVDGTAPDLTISSGPDDQVFAQGSTQTWAFTAADDTLAAVECSVVEEGEAASYGACSGGSTGHSVSGLAEGAHRFFVRATDGAGLFTIEERAFTIDDTSPGLSVTAGPDGGAFKTGTAQTWAFSASDANLAAVECSVVAVGQPESFGPCSGGSTGHSVSGLPHGTHEFSVRAVDSVGHTTVRERTFTIDGTLPKTILDKKPGDRVVTTRLRATVRFEFHSNETAATFQCRLDSGSWQSCTSPKIYRLHKGEHVVRIRAVDLAGNRDATPSTTRFRVVRR